MRWLVSTQVSYCSLTQSVEFLFSDAARSYPAPDKCIDDEGNTLAGAWQQWVFPAIVCACGSIPTGDSGARQNSQRTVARRFFWCRLPVSGQDVCVVPRYSHDADAIQSVRIHQGRQLPQSPVVCDRVCSAVFFWFKARIVWFFPCLGALQAYLVLL